MRQKSIAKCDNETWPPFFLVPHSSFLISFCHTPSESRRGLAKTESQSVEAIKRVSRQVAQATTELTGGAVA